MNKYWNKKSQKEIKSIIFEALEHNVNYAEQNTIGIPASHLDDQVFNKNASFVKDAPFISTLIQNPNHIGCHTLGKSESIFEGTQEIEKELIEICSVDILKAEPLSIDGYVASGGTEANIQAIWVYRNYFLNERSAKREDICILCSEDSHYSMDKASNLLAINLYKIAVDFDTRELSSDAVGSAIKLAQSEGKKHFVVVCNMMTTMFGSVDNIDIYTEQLDRLSCDYKLHVDGAFGGFYYPFSSKSNDLTFENPAITSVTLDAHKMAQAPYGTGIFLIRKGLIHHVNTKEASYVEGEDFTLIGSRSGANAVAVWMILMKIGPFGWHEKIFILQKRTAWMSDELEQLDIGFYRHPNSNIITIKSEFVDREIAAKFGLVPDNHNDASWYKIVVMEHVTIEKLSALIEQLKIATQTTI